MFGTIGRVKVQSGKLDDLIAIGERWGRERGPNVPGAIGAWWFQSDGDPNEVTIVAIFRDRDTYFANASSPEQDAWYQQMRALLTEEPVWNDGAIVVSGRFNGI